MLPKKSGGLESIAGGPEEQSFHAKSSPDRSCRLLNRKKATYGDKGVMIQGQRTFEKTAYLRDKGELMLLSLELYIAQRCAHKLAKCLQRPTTWTMRLQGQVSSKAESGIGHQWLTVNIFVDPARHNNSSLICKHCRRPLKLHHVTASHRPRRLLDTESHNLPGKKPDKLHSFKIFPCIHHLHF